MDVLFKEIMQFVDYLHVLIHRTEKNFWLKINELEESESIKILVISTLELQ